MRWDSRLPLKINVYFLQLSVPTSSQRRFIHMRCDKYRSTVSETNILNTTQTDTNQNHLQFLPLSLLPPAYGPRRTLTSFKISFKASVSPSYFLPASFIRSFSPSSIQPFLAFQRTFPLLGCS